MPPFLTLKGKGVRRMRSVLWFFLLAGAIQWPGLVWIRRPPPKGTNQPWVLQYEGAYAAQYYWLLTRRKFAGCKDAWSEEISMDYEVIRK